MGKIRDSQKKLAVINDLSGFGRCSIAVELPIISAMKIQCCFVPTTIFSNHTGFTSFFLEDFTDKMRPYMDEWRKLELHFQGICTGFLGSPEQIAIVSDFLRDFKEKDTVVIVDPRDGGLWENVSDLLHGDLPEDAGTDSACGYHYAESDGGLHSGGYSL